jgi:protoporphyrin/coproporphyrin ferrochelatase
MSDSSPPDTIAPPVRPAASVPSMPAATVEVPKPTPASERVKASAIKVGVLLVNLGTPDSADAAGVRRYLTEFLADKRVIEDQGLIWKIVLNGIILRFRPRSKARDYQKIWNTELDESPLKTFTRSQAQKLANTLNLFGNHIIVDWAMRYGNPSIASRVTELCNQGCERLLVIPLYPQYSAATSATVCDEVFRVLTNLRRQPTLRIAAPYYDDSIYIDALANTLRAELTRLSFEPDVIVASFHGMPQAYVDKGDPYFDQCVMTTKLLRQKLGMDEQKLMLTFQSRFGRARWLEPATIDSVKALAKRGVKNLAVITPGFAADCLETLEEIGVENANVFKRYGGENFVTIPCLNDSDPGMLVIRHVALRELKGWV